MRHEHKRETAHTPNKRTNIKHNQFNVVVRCRRRRPTAATISIFCRNALQRCSSACNLFEFIQYVNVFSCKRNDYLKRLIINPKCAASRMCIPREQQQQQQRKTCALAVRMMHLYTARGSTARACGFINTIILYVAGILSSRSDRARAQRSSLYIRMHSLRGMVLRIQNTSVYIYQIYKCFHVVCHRRTFGWEQTHTNTCSTTLFSASMRFN